MKNIDKLKEMSVEELITFINGNECDRCIYDNTNCMHDMCSEGTKAWLDEEHELTIEYLNYSFNKFCNNIKSKNNGECHTCYYAKNGYLVNCKDAFIVRNFNIVDGKITKTISKIQ